MEKIRSATEISHVITIICHCFRQMQLEIKSLPDILRRVVLGKAGQWYPVEMNVDACGLSFSWLIRLGRSPAKGRNISNRIRLVFRKIHGSNGSNVEPIHKDRAGNKRVKMD